MSTLNILGICGSIRSKSTNLGVLRFIQEQSPDSVSMTIADLSGIPFFNQDLTQTPESVNQLFEQMKAADGFIFACPEYNYSIAPALKNAIDWASRAPNNELFAGKHAAIVGAGGGMGTSRAQYHLRQVCVYLDLHIINKPEVFINAFKGSFDELGNLIGEKEQELVRKQLHALLTVVEKNKLMALHEIKTTYQNLIEEKKDNL